MASLLSDEQQHTPTGSETPTAAGVERSLATATSQQANGSNPMTETDSSAPLQARSAADSPTSSRLGFLRSHTPPPALTLSSYSSAPGNMSPRSAYPFARTPSATDVHQQVEPFSRLSTRPDWTSSVSTPTAGRPSAVDRTAVTTHPGSESTVVDINLEDETPAQLVPPFRPASRNSNGSGVFSAAAASIARSSSGQGWRASDEDSEAQGSSHGHGGALSTGMTNYQVPAATISRTSSACGSVQNGYASSIDGDFQSAPPSRMISRAPTPSRYTGVNVNALTQALPTTGSAADQGHGPLGASGVPRADSPTDSDADADKDMPNSEWDEYGSGGSATAGGSSRASGLYSMWGLGAAWQRSRPGSESTGSGGIILGSKRPRSTSKDKNGWAASRVPLLNRSFSPPSSGSSSSGTSSRRRLRSSRRRDRSSGPTLGAILTLPLRAIRTVVGPVHPLTIIIALVLISAFVTSVTTLIIYILNPDKEHVPYRQYCAMQPDFPHAAADALEPVDVFVGVFSIDTAYERRHLIRNTYAAHSLPLDPRTGFPTANVQVKFILGRTKKSHSRRVALEMEMFNDIVVLDIDENMNRGKTHAYFAWAAENATVPIVVQKSSEPVSALNRGRYPGVGHDAMGQDYYVRWKKADFVVKADDDSLIVLDELERHLRIAPRKLTYWGYLIRDWFMGGECYALSSDLVQYVASSAEVAANIKGKEDKTVAHWVHMHPESSRVNWVSERCWIYDHAKAGTAYSHGFLYPDEVQRIKAEAKRGLSDQETARRGGEHNAKAYSSVSRWKVPYRPPRSDMTIEEEVEALVEGGGRWSSWTRGESGNDTQTWLNWDQLVYEANDTRLFQPSTRSASTTRDDTQGRMTRKARPSGLNIRAIAEEERGEEEKRGLGWFQDAGPDTEVAAAAGSGGRLLAAPLVFLSHLGIGRNARGGGGVQASQRADEPRLLPLPTSKEGHPSTGPNSSAALRSKRYLGRPHGGTVVVHFLKKSEWFMETAIALLGRERLWVDGAGGAGSEWRMWGPSLVRDNGYIAAGRSQPRRVG